MEIVQIKEALNISLMAGFVLDCCQANNKSYPLLSSDKEIQEELIKCINNEDCELLCISDGENIKGLFGFFSIQEDHYLQTTICCILDSKEPLILFLEYLVKHYNGYDAFIGIAASNEMVMKCLVENGYNMVDDLLDYRFEFGSACGFGASACENVEHIELGTLDEYLEFHREKNNTEGEYWTAERLRRDFKNWDIYIIRRNGHISSSICIRCFDRTICEVFSANIGCRTDADALIAAMLYDLRNRRAECSAISMMLEPSEVELVSAASKYGFVQISRYCCLKMRIQLNIS